MKTIVLFFVLVAFAGVSVLPIPAGAASVDISVIKTFPSRKHKAKESKNEFVDTSNNDWPQPASLGQFGVPEGFGGGPSGGGQSEGGPSGGGPNGGGASEGGPSGEGPSGGGQGSGDNDNSSRNSRVKSSRRRN